MSDQAHGYATHEFEVTEERLGVYLPVGYMSSVIDTSLNVFSAQVEHIDNPKGYGDGEDARKYDPRLRPPVEVCLTCSSRVRVVSFDCSYSR